MLDGPVPKGLLVGPEGSTDPLPEVFGGAEEDGGAVRIQRAAEMSRSTPGELIFCHSFQSWTPYSAVASTLPPASGPE